MISGATGTPVSAARGGAAGSYPAVRTSGGFARPPVCRPSRSGVICRAPGLRSVRPCSGLRVQRGQTTPPRERRRALDKLRAATGWRAGGFGERKGTRESDSGCPRVWSLRGSPAEARGAPGRVHREAGGGRTRTTPPLRPEPQGEGGASAEQRAVAGIVGHSGQGVEDSWKGQEGG